MGNVNVDISMSLDGFVAGPNRTLDTPLGQGGELLHEWVIATKSWREVHGKSGGEDTPDDEIARESIEAAGATVIGRRKLTQRAGMRSPGQRRRGRVGGRPQRRRLVGRRPTVPPPGVRPHPARERADDDEGRDDLHVRDRRHRERARAGEGGRG